MTKKLAYWLVLEAVFVAILVIAIFFLDDIVTRVLLGIVGALGTVTSTVMVARIGSARSRN